MTTEVQQIRKAIGMTQTEMAEVLGLGLRAYQDIEAGKSKERPGHVRAARQHQKDYALRCALFGAGQAPEDRDQLVAHHARRQIHHYREDLDQARRAIAAIDAGTLAIHERTADHPAQRDITAERRAELERQIRQLEELVILWKGHLPAGEEVD